MSTSADDATGRSDSISGSRRDRILNVAVDEFALHGFGAVRIDRIAELAGCNKQLIYYYFKSKNGLYDAVFQHLLEYSRPHWEAMGTGTFQEAMIRQADWTSREVYQRRWVRLFVMDELDVAAHERDEAREEDRRRERWQASIDFVRSRQEAGEVDPKFDAPMVALLTRLLFSMPPILPQVVSLMTGDRPTDPAFADRFRGLVADVSSRMSAADRTTTR